MTGWETHWDRGEPGLADAFSELGGADGTSMLASVGLTVVSEPTAVSGQENRILRATTDGGSVFALKAFRYGRLSDAALTEQLELVASLCAAGVPVAAPVRLPHGSLLGRWEGQQFALFEWHEEAGAHPRDRRDADFTALGAGIARVHLCHADQLRHAKRYTPSTWGRASLDYLLAHNVVHTAVRADFARTAEMVLLRASEAWPAEPLVPIHSDLAVWNILWPSAGAPAMIDFEDLGLGVAWHDLYLLPHSLGADEGTTRRIEADLHAGYSAVRPLPEGGPRLSGLLEAMRGLYIDCWIAARRHDRHFGVRRLTFHTKRHWLERTARLERYAGLGDDD